jgi:hypothetical protein
MIKVLADIDITPILDCYQQLEHVINWTDYGHKGKQAGVQYKYGAVLLDAVKETT